MKKFLLVVTALPTVSIGMQLYGPEAFNQYNQGNDTSALAIFKDGAEKAPNRLDKMYCCYGFVKCLTDKGASLTDEQQAQCANYLHSILSNSQWEIDPRGAIIERTKKEHFVANVKEKLIFLHKKYPASFDIMCALALYYRNTEQFDEFLKMTLDITKDIDKVTEHVRIINNYGILQSLQTMRVTLNVYGQMYYLLSCARLYTAGLKTTEEKPFNQTRYSCFDTVRKYLDEIWYISHSLTLKNPLLFRTLARQIEYHFDQYEKQYVHELINAKKYKALFNDLVVRYDRSPGRVLALITVLAQAMKENSKYEELYRKSRANLLKSVEQADKDQAKIIHGLYVLHTGKDIEAKSQLLGAAKNDLIYSNLIGLLCVEGTLSLTLNDLQTLHGAKNASDILCNVARQCALKYLERQPSGAVVFNYSEAEDQMYKLARAGNYYVACDLAAAYLKMNEDKDLITCMLELSLGNKYIQSNQIYNGLIDEFSETVDGLLSQKRCSNEMAQLFINKIYSISAAVSRTDALAHASKFQALLAKMNAEKKV